MAEAGGAPREGGVFVRLLVGECLWVRAAAVLRRQLWCWSGAWAATAELSPVPPGSLGPGKGTHVLYVPHSA